jgi:hypothetical protein
MARMRRNAVGYRQAVTVPKGTRPYSGNRTSCPRCNASFSWLALGTVRCLCGYSYRVAACALCGRWFRPLRRDAGYCSNVCRQGAYRLRKGAIVDA